MKGIAGMADVIAKLARSGTTLDKAVSALIVLREGCLETREDERYNAFLHLLKREHGPRREGDAALRGGTPFWQRVVAQATSGTPLTLFSVADGPTVETTPEEAQAFFTSLPEPPAPPPVQPPAPPPTGAADVYDDLE